MSKNLNSEMPYERFKTFGKENLTNAELIAIILRTGCEGQSALELASSILTLKGTPPRLSVLYDLSLKELLSIRGIGEVKAVKLLCIGELSRRMAAETKANSLSFSSPDSVADYYMESLRHEKQEKVLLILLDNKLHFIRDEVLTLGTVNSSLLSPRDVFIKAAAGGAVHIMLLHNHPSGDPTPSMQDIDITKKIKKLGQMMDIQLIDHIVIGDGDYISLKEAGYI